MNKTVVVKDQAWILAPPEIVWDFTQDYSRRADWDRSILQASVLAETPQRRVQIVAVGNLSCVFQYRQSERPRRTSLSMVDVRSPLVAGGGGAWAYEPDRGGTRWEVTNTLVLRNALLYVLFGRIVGWQLRRATRRALEMVKAMIEGRS
jgi:hypothetical protein